MSQVRWRGRAGRRGRGLMFPQGRVVSVPGELERVMGEGGGGGCCCSLSP